MNFAKFQKLLHVGQIPPLLRAVTRMCRSHKVYFSNRLSGAIPKLSRYEEEFCEEDSLTLMLFLTQIRNTNMECSKPGNILQVGTFMENPTRPFQTAAPRICREQTLAYDDIATFFY